MTLDLHTGAYKPYRKPNDQSLYINTNSNHPPSIIKELPHNISKRISEISSSEEIFNEAAPYYNDALKSSGYKGNIKYTPISDPEQKRRIRKQKILWFNPPYSMNVKTNIARNFLQLLDKHFPPGHKLHTIFNRNNVKVSYRCTPRTASTSNSHNKKILENQPSNTIAACNCRVKDSSPLQGKCQTENVVYLAQVTNRKNSERKCYIGLTERTFKDRLYKHRNSLRHRSKANSTELKYIWNLKDKSLDETDVSWSILDISPPYKNGTRTCQLCLREKYHIIFLEEGNLLNKRSEIL